MDLREWSKSNVDYGKRLLDSGIEGARSGGEAFLKGKPLTPYLGESARGALKLAAVGAFVGLLAGYPIHRRRKPVNGALVFGLLGGLIGLGTGLAWESRELSASMAGSALKSIGRVRDEQWLNRNPIDYA